ncbi:MAG: ComEC/Rec2 family competence protein, partial [Rhodoferax sp.]
MRSDPFTLHGLARVLFAALLGFVLGTAVQLQQAALFGASAYAPFVLLALVVYGLGAIDRVAIGWRMALVALALGLLGFGVTGLRAMVYQTDVLDPALEGRDVRVTGVVASMPQRNESGLRFRLALESATLDGEAVRLPPRIDVGWYGGAFSDEAAVPVVGLNRLPADVRAGERWEMTLRLKAPHGSRNPHGFDYELWLWEQGVQATGYVRASARDPVPQRLGQTWHHPVALARQTVRERIYARVPDRQAAGMLAALVV